MRALAVVAVIVLASACGKKAAPKAPSADPANVERKPAPEPGEASEPAPGAPVPVKSVVGDPCSGGEKK